MLSYKETKVKKEKKRKEKKETTQSYSYSLLACDATVLNRAVTNTTFNHIDITCTVVHDIQLAKNQKKFASAFFVDVKSPFDHVSVNQLPKKFQGLGLPKGLCLWIESFL